MAPKEGRRATGAKGFASMDEEKKKQIASKGGLASAKANKTSNRGFASMDKNKQRQISSKGGKASKGYHPERNEDDVEQSDIIKEEDDSASDLSSRQEEDNLESSGKTQGSLASSETDEDEDEGLGDGKIGRSTRGGV